MSDEGPGIPEEDIPRMLRFLDALPPAVNFCPKNFAELSDHARRALRRMRRRSTLVRSFWQQAQLL